MSIKSQKTILKEDEIISKGTVLILGKTGIILHNDKEML